MDEILLIEDDKDYAAIVSEILTDEGYIVSVANSSKEGIAAAKNKLYNLIIIDLDLDALNGIQVAEVIRRQYPGIPVIILTGSVNDEDEVKVLELGINDYVRKSVSFTVLLGRIHHVLEMAHGEDASVLTLESLKENITVDLTARIVKKDDKEVYLTVLEYDLLVYMLRNKKRALSRDELMKKVWKFTELNDTDARIVDTFIKNLRSKLDIHSIYSIRGIGYRWHE